MLLIRMDLCKEESDKMASGQQGYNSNLAPFMENNKSDKIIPDPNINDKLAQIQLPEIIKQFYRDFSSSTQEIYLNNWTLFSLDNILNMSKEYHLVGVPTIDLGFTYMGMGHVHVAFYHPKFDTILFRMDGGSNDWDRKDNRYDLINFDHTKFKKGILFEQFIKNIKSSTPFDF